MCPLYCPNNACFAEKAFHIPREAVLRAYGNKRLHCARKAAAVNAGDAVLSWTSGEVIPAATTLTMELTESTDGKTAGDYSDTLTFKLSVTG